jgi:hypothetical protein
MSLSKRKRVVKPAEPHKSFVRLRMTIESGKQKKRGGAVWVLSISIS